MLPPLPESQVELHLPSGLFLVRRAVYLDLKLVRIRLGHGTAQPPQRELQVEEKAWVTDENVQSR